MSRDSGNVSVSSNLGTSLRPRTVLQEMGNIFLSQEVLGRAYVPEQFSRKNSGHKFQSQATLGRACVPE